MRLGHANVRERCGSAADCGDGFLSGSLRIHAAFCVLAAAQGKNLARFAGMNSSNAFSRIA